MAPKNGWLPLPIIGLSPGLIGQHRLEHGYHLQKPERFHVIDNLVDVFVRLAVLLAKEISIFAYHKVVDPSFLVAGTLQLLAGESSELVVAL